MPPQPESARRWDRLHEVRGWPPVTEQPYVSLGHPPGHYQAEVRVSPDARDAYLALTPGSELPVGAVVAQLQHDPVEDQPGPVFVMVKRAPDRWDFMAVDRDGRIRADNDSGLCQRCHADAASDHLFGLPQPRAAPDAGMP